jgi:hypothetical protein
MTEVTRIETRRLSRYKKFIKRKPRYWKKYSTSINNKVIVGVKEVPVVVAAALSGAAVTLTKLLPQDIASCCAAGP